MEIENAIQEARRTPDVPTEYYNEKAVEARLNDIDSRNKIFAGIHEMTTRQKAERRNVEIQIYG